LGQRIALKRVAKVTYGLGQPPPASDSGIAIIRATNITKGRITADNLIYAQLADLPLVRAPLLKVNEILVVRSGAYTGDSALITDEWAGSAPGYDLRVSPHSIEPRLLAHQLLGAHVQGQIDLVRMRAAQPHLNAEDLGSIVVWKGAADAETTTADLLDAVQAARRLIETAIDAQIACLLERRQALITAAVIGGLEIPGVVAA
jgi:type I restriction enzyme S subunit